MKSIKGISLVVVFGSLFVLFNVKTAHTLAQEASSQDDKIPSDLSLDLKLAEQNPAPERKDIIASETKTAQIVSPTETTTVKPVETVAPEVKNEPAQAAEHPEQTTSEQVVSTPVVVEEKVSPTGEDQNQTPEDQSQLKATPNPSSGPANPEETAASTGSTGSFVPGTSVLAPDDNAAPADNSTNPNLPAPTPMDNLPLNAPPSDQPLDQKPDDLQNGTQNPSVLQPANPPATPASSDNSQPAQTSQDAGTVPQPQEQAKPQSEPDNGSVQQQTANNPPPSSDSNQQSNPPSSDNSGNNEQPKEGESDKSVQGASTGPINFLRKIINRLFFFWIKQ